MRRLTSWLGHRLLDWSEPLPSFEEHMTRSYAEREPVWLALNEPDEPFDIVAVTEVLWCGWEGEHTACLVAFKDDPCRLVLTPRVRGLDDQPVAEVLRERIQAYRRAIVETQRLLETARREGVI